MYKIIQVVLQAVAAVSVGGGQVRIWKRSWSSSCQFDFVRRRWLQRINIESRRVEFPDKRSRPLWLFIISLQKPDRSEEIIFRQEWGLLISPQQGNRRHADQYQAVVQYLQLSTADSVLPQLHLLIPHNYKFWDNAWRKGITALVKYASFFSPL